MDPQIFITLLSELKSLGKENIKSFWRIYEFSSLAARWQ